MPFPVDISGVVPPIALQARDEIRYTYPKRATIKSILAFSEGTDPL